MKFSDIDPIMSKDGISGDPAFNNVKIKIATIESDDRYAPLGLYYPGENDQRIIIPPDCDESTLLHELGHRHGAYYYGDLSEEYAENFRKTLEAGVTSPIALTRMPHTGTVEPLMRVRADDEYSNWNVCSGG